MPTINVFNSMQSLEPKCPKCETVIKYGLNTRFDDKKQTHVCENCNTVLK